MVKLFVSYCISALIIFGLLTGGTFGTIASIWLWVMVALMIFFNIILLAVMAASNKIPWPSNYKWSNNAHIMLHPFTRVITFMVSIFTAFIAYQEGYHNLAVVYGLMVVVGAAVVSMWIKLMKRIYG